MRIYSVREAVMKTRVMVMGMFLAAMLVATGTASAVEMKKGGLLGNSWASEVRQIDDTTLRITTRKKVSGDLDEVNKPGTTMNKALAGVKNGTSARAAVEAKNLGYDVIQVLGSRDLTQVQEKRNASGGLGESGFTFAPGHYSNEVELAIEVTVKLIPGMMPENPPEDYADVNAILMQFGLMDLFAAKL
jgi:hypothetical protein